MKLPTLLRNRGPSWNGWAGARTVLRPLWVRSDGDVGTGSDVHLQATRGGRGASALHVCSAAVPGCEFRGRPAPAATRDETSHKLAGEDACATVRCGRGTSAFRQAGFT